MVAVEEENFQTDWDSEGEALDDSKEHGIEVPSFLASSLMKPTERPPLSLKIKLIC